MVIYIEEYLPKGPLAPIAGYGRESCRRYSWTNLLYVNDFVHTGECMGVTWYLACDMQMYWFSPFAILPLWYSEKIGLLLWGLYLIAFTVIPGYVTGHFHFGPTVVIRDEDTVDGVGDDINYFRSYTRVQPYLIGIMLGYILFKQEGNK